MGADCKKVEEKSIKIFHGKAEWYLNHHSSCLLNPAKSLRKEKNHNIAETPKITGKVETSKINIQRRNTITVALAVDVTTNIAHINRQQTNPSNRQKNGLHYQYLKRPIFKIMTKVRPIIMNIKINIS